jgi:hypothetical protein
MKRLEGHLHPKLEVPGMTCVGRESEPGPPRWEASTLEKSHSNILLIGSYSEHLHMSAQPVVNARDSLILFIWPCFQIKSLI